MEEQDGRALRYFCINCGRDYWVPLLIPIATVEELEDRSSRIVGRRCLDCGDDISKRHRNSVRCVDCSNRADKWSRESNKRRVLEVAA